MTAFSEFPPDVQVAAVQAGNDFLRDPRCGVAVRFGMILATRDALLEAIAGAIAADRAKREPRRHIGLTARQAETLHFVAAYQAQHGGVSPTFEEIANALGVSSKSSVSRIVDALEERGCISRLTDKARSITILPAHLGQPPRSGQVAASGHPTGV